MTKMGWVCGRSAAGAGSGVSRKFRLAAYSSSAAGAILRTGMVGSARGGLPGRGGGGEGNGPPAAGLFVRLGRRVLLLADLADLVLELLDVLLDLLEVLLHLAEQLLRLVGQRHVL